MNPILLAARYLFIIGVICAVLSCAFYLMLAVPDTPPLQKVAAWLFVWVTYDIYPYRKPHH
jgi:hypothetical protein